MSPQTLMPFWPGALTPRRARQGWSKEFESRCAIAGAVSRQLLTISPVDQRAGTGVIWYQIKRLIASWAMPNT